LMRIERMPAPSAVSVFIIHTAGIAHDAFITQSMISKMPPNEVGQMHH
jgi:hypothetical protein